MDPKFQTSFIPRRPVVPGTGVRKRSSLNFISVLGVLIFLISLGLAGASLFYERTLIASNEQKKKEIQDQIKAFDPGLTKELSVLKARIDSAKLLLDKHLAITSFFSLLEDNTVTTVKFDDLRFDISADGKFLVKMGGQAISFNDMVYQSDKMLENDFIKNARFAGFQLDDQGRVKFSFDSELDPSLISYKRSLEEISTAVPTPPTPPANQPESTTP